MEKKPPEVKAEMRLEKDSLGELALSKDVLYGVQTERARLNFPLSDLKLPPTFISALGLIKAASAKANLDLGLLDVELAKAIIDAAESVADNQYDAQFPLDVFQTGSGTSTNMNANEVIAHVANFRRGLAVHPNDHVNKSQSSNDVIPTAIHLSASLQLHNHLLPALRHLEKSLNERSQALISVPKMGRTHLMDALPITFGQEISGWKRAIAQDIVRIENTLPRLHALALGGTAVGTGLNAHPEFAARAIVQLSERTNLPLMPASNYFEALSTQDSVVELSGQLKVLAVSLSKIANDLRWMNSGPLAGLSEIQLQALQPGSSIMPGKINPVIPEAVLGCCAQVIGNDVTITLGGLGGNFQLNTMLPVIAYNSLQSIQLMANAAKNLADKAIATFTVNETEVSAKLAQNPILVTALNPIIGYEKAAEIAKKAYAEGRPILDVACDMTELSREELTRVLDPKALTQGGIQDVL